MKQCLIFLITLTTCHPVLSMASFRYPESVMPGSIVRNGFLLGLGTSAALLLAHWLFSESDQQLIIRAQRFSEETYKQHAILLELFDRKYDLLQASYLVEQQMQNATENEIYDVALYMWERRISYQDLQQELMQAINNLSSLLYSLDLRQHKIEEHIFHGKSYEDLVQEIRHFILHISSLREKLNIIKRYITMHATYFELFEIDGLLRNKYNVPIEYVQLYGNNPYECAYKMREWALNQEIHARAFHAIVAELKDDIFRLGKTIVNTKSAYQHRITTAQQLRDVLKYVKSMLTIDPLYSQETAYAEWQQIQQVQ